MESPNYLPSASLEQNDLIEQYLTATIQNYGEKGTIFAPWLILQHMELARNFAKRIALKSNGLVSSGFCVLAESGLPIGILVAQAMGKPMFFYRKTPWQIEDKPGPWSIFPPVPPGSALTLVDSHITTGFTASSCHDFLKQMGVFVDNIACIITFQDLPGVTPHWRSIHPISLSTALAHRATLLDRLGAETWDQVYSLMTKAANNARGLSFGLKSADDVGYLLTKPNRLRTILQYLLYAVQSKLQIKYVDQKLAKELRSHFGASESELWRFFTHPDWVRRVCLCAGESLGIDSYDVIVATDTLGTIFALCLAWHNNFTGRIVSNRSPVGWDDLNHMRNPVQCLVCSARLHSGYHVSGTIKLLSRFHIEPKAVLALRLSTEGIGFPHNRVLFELLKFKAKPTILG
jgi:hypothetical protein